MILDTDSLVSQERLHLLFQEAENQLEQLQPRIDELENMVQELRELKQTKQRLLTLKMSLMTLIDTSKNDDILLSNTNLTTDSFQDVETKLFNFNELSAIKMFHPDVAFKQADQILKQKDSLNYQIFKAVVYQGGKANTEQIRQFLVDSGVQQPHTKKGFEDVPLTEISSRANYLVRKGVLKPLERGSFYSILGWLDPEGN